MTTEKLERVELEINGRQLSLEPRNLAEQASGQVLLKYGDTLILATAVLSQNPVGSQNFFPLTVEYEEKYYAAGKIKGSRYVKREGKPSDKAVLSARLIDRTIRPRFPKELMREVQVVVTVLSWDTQNDPDVLGINAASLALSLSNIPWKGPLAALKVGHIDNQFVANPANELQEKSDCELVVVGDFDEKGDLVVNMLESESQEVSEEIITGAVEFAKPFLKQIIDFQKQITEKYGRVKETIASPVSSPDLERDAKGFLKDKIEAVLFQKDKPTREKEETQLRNELVEFVKLKYPAEDAAKFLNRLFDEELDQALVRGVLKNGQRPDGRKVDELRPLSAEVGLLPRTHGSGLFCRGTTKALSILTLGAPGDQQIMEGMEISGKKRFMHHYNFPPYSVGETKPMRGPGRREIGHGMLAERAILSLIPDTETFPYTIRVVSEIVSSNGSTSMASVCGTSLALMDAGVPIKRAVAGISIGLVLDEKTKEYALLTDIQGPEDHHGGMDFKVAGTREGITVLQMDVKVAGITQTMIKETLQRAKEARQKILDVMDKTIGQPRAQLSPYAPRILTLQINPDKIREVVGPGGKIINEIIAATGAAIDIEQSGLIFITSETEAGAQKAFDWISNITHEVKVGETFEGRVSRIFDFGAMVEFLPSQEGLIHISELANYRVAKVEDIVKIGDVVPVKVVSIDQQGRVNLSLKQMRPDGPRQPNKT